MAMPADRPPLILVVEDHEVSRRLLGDFLQAQQATVLMARDGREAITQAHAAHPDLILMDIQMPNLNGLEAIRQLKAASDTASTPIIALTALARPVEREACLAAGVDGYLSKPVKLAELTREVARLLMRKTP